MGVHRIHDAAEAALDRIMKREGGGRRRGEVVSQLIVDYDRGLSFDRRPSVGPTDRGPDGHYG